MGIGPERLLSERMHERALRFMLERKAGMGPETLVDLELRELGDLRN